MVLSYPPRSYKVLQLCFYSSESQKSYSRCFSKHSTGHTFPILLTPTTDLKSLKANGQLQSTHSHPSTTPSSLLYGFPLVWLTLERRWGSTLGAELLSSLPQQDNACAPCNAALQWLVPSAHRFTCWHALQKTNNSERRKLTRFIGSGKPCAVLLLSQGPLIPSPCSALLRWWFLWQPSASCPRNSLAAALSPSSPHRPPLRLWCSFNLPQAAAVALLPSHSPFSLRHTEAEATLTPTQHRHGCAQPPPAAFTSSVLTGLSIS